MKLILDECITPRGANCAWDLGVDVAHICHRGRSGTSDTALWQYAEEEGRAIVTINEGDFVSMAKRKTHKGLVVMPSGLCRDDQVACLRAMCNFVVAEDKDGRTLENRIIWTDDSGAVREEHENAQRRLAIMRPQYPWTDSWKVFCSRLRRKQSERGGPA
jgi:predicted nuclease of predicted toxin-antitoxin system